MGRLTDKPWLASNRQFLPSPVMEGNLCR